MTPDVVAVARRERVALAAVVADSRSADGTGMLSLTAEDGARFQFPAAMALVRCAGPSPQAPGETTPQWLARLRSSIPAPPAWRDLHAKATEGVAYDAAELAALAGLDGVAGRLAVALAAADAEPWFRREGARFTAAPRGRAEAREARVAEAHRAHEEDEALRRWWPARLGGPAPAEAAGALKALVAFALHGVVEATERGRVLAAKLDLPEPDQVLEALVAVGALEDTVDPSPYRAGLSEGFAADATAEAARIAATPVDRSARLDLTDLAAVAVDDAETTEVDDAISVREGTDGPELLVHIADVAAAISVGSTLDRAIDHRVSSLYLPEGSVSMLPSSLVPRLSLEAGVVHEALTGVFRVGEDGKVAAASFARSLVRVTRRATYEATADVAALAATSREGRILCELAERLRRARIAAGALVVQVESLKVTARDGIPHLELRHQATPGDLVVAEAMVLYNAAAARLLATADAPAFYRTQDAPREPEPRADDPLRTLRLRRRFAPAAPSIEPGRHHGVGVDAYLQATSPIRRFADLVNQRQLAAVALGTRPPYRHGDLERAVGPMIERERRVRQASEHRADHWLARAFEGRVGDVVQGVLARPPRRGLGSVWVPELARELPLRPVAEWTAPAEGTWASWRVARVAPWRGRIELEPVVDPASR